MSSINFICIYNTAIIIAVSIAYIRIINTVETAPKLKPYIKQDAKEKI